MAVISGVGTVYIWKDYPKPKDDTKPKKRWVIYLGLELDGTNFIALITTTTNPTYPNSLLLSSDDTPFDKNCYINFDDKPQPVDNKVIDNCKDKIFLKGILGNKYLIEIYEHIYKSNQYTQIQVTQLYKNLISIGIKGVSDPIKRQRRFGQIVIDK